MAVKAKNAVSSGRQLARELGVGESTVRGYLARPDWPAQRRAPWSEADVGRIRAWQATLQEDRGRDAGGGGSNAERVNTGLKLERLLHERVKREERQAVLVRRELLDAGLEAMTRLYVRGLDDLVHTLPGQLASLADFPDTDRRDVLTGKIEQLVRAGTYRIRQDLADRTRVEIDAAELQLARERQARRRGRPASAR